MVSAVVDAYGKVEAEMAVEVIAPFDPIVVVAVPPTASWFAEKTEVKSVVPVAVVNVSPPLKFKSVEVALPVKRYEKLA